MIAWKTSSLRKNINLENTFYAVIAWETSPQVLRDDSMGNLRYN